MSPSLPHAAGTVGFAVSAATLLAVLSSSLLRRTRLLPVLCTLLFMQAASANEAIVRIARQPGPECQAPCERVAVVFFHGLMGSEKTWKNPDTQADWPSLLANDPALTGKLDIYTVSYASFMFRRNPSFVAVLGDMRKQLDDLFFEKKYSKIVLIGHSLGGNFARAYLLKVKQRFGHRPLSAFRLMFTLGTPVHGSDLATFARYLSGNPHIRVLQPFPVNDFQQLMESNWQDALDKQHRDFCDKIVVRSAFEKRATPVGIIVTKASATAAADFSEGFDLDHGGLAKPADRNARIYQWVADGLQACVQGDTVCVAHGEYPNCGRGGHGVNTNRGMRLWDEGLRSVPASPADGH